MTGAPSSGSPAQAVPEWDQVIEELERAVCTGAPYEPPTGLPPLPARLERRAEEVLSAMQHRSQEILAERDAVSRELAALHRSSRGTTRRRAMPSATTSSHAHGTQL